MNCTATDPSPTPEATRFIEPWRTSPTAKIPGTLVSSKNGSRSSPHPFGRCPSRIRSGPVKRKPRSSRSTIFASQSVLGNAGMCPQLNVRCLLNLVNQILRHGAGKRLAAHKYDDALCISGEVHRRLTCRVRAAHHIDDLTL